MKCKYCDKWLGTNDEAEYHAGECPVMTGDNQPDTPLPEPEAHEEGKNG